MEFTSEEAVEKILSIWDGPSQEALTRRVRVLFALARNHQDGYIVELGTHHGYGAFALAYGAWHSKIVTVDDYKKKVGWAGEQYTPHDFAVFTSNLFDLELQSHIIRVHFDVVPAANIISDGTVSLLYIDTGIKDDLPSIVDAWCKKIKTGGVIAFRDTLNRALGCDRLADNLMMTGKFILMDSPDDYFVMVEKI